MGASKTLKQAQQNQQSIASTQLANSSQLSGQAQNQFTQRSSLNQKPIDFYTTLASGDQSKMSAAAAVPIANIAKEGQNATAAIEDTVAPGAARNFALAQVKRDQAGQNATFLNQAYLSSFPALQGLATDAGNFGLQQLGAGLGQLQGASQTNALVAQQEQQRQAAKLNMIGGLAGTAGKIAAAPFTGGASLAIPGGGGGGLNV